MDVCVADELMPNCLKGFGIDWTGYSLPGGAGFQERFVELVPELAKSIVKANRHIDRLKADHARRVELVEHLEGVRKGLGRLMDGGDAVHGAWYLEYVLQAVDHVSVDVDTEGVAKKVAETEADIRFMVNLMEYVKADREVDMMLYGIYFVEPKYKAMVFRELTRAMRRVESAQVAVNTSRSAVKAGTEHLFGGLYDTLDKSYALLIPHFKKLKKMVAEIGAATVFKDSGYQRLLHREFEMAESMRRAS